MKIDADMQEILKSAVIVNGWHVSADTLVPIGKLIAGGYLKAEDDYEGPRLIPTEKARKTALRLKLVRWDKDRAKYTHPELPR